VIQAVCVARQVSELGQPSLNTYKNSLLFTPNTVEENKILDISIARKNIEKNNLDFQRILRR